MKVIADLHMHGRFSRATSTQLNVPNLTKYARIKGLNLMGTGDCTHPTWLQELKQDLAEDGTGILRDKEGFGFILSGEISSIYSQDGKVRRVHNIILARSFEVADQINEALTKRRVNLKSDGRPICGIPCPELVELIMGADREAEVIPAHAWTPWFSVFGSESGFDRIEDCYKDQTRNIHALETGLSCYDEETEVLTDNGWKKFSEVLYDDRICTLNIATDEIEFQTPTKIQTYNYKGKMYRLRNKRVDLFVTPNHNLLFSPCDFRKPPKFSLKEAELLFNKSKRLKKDGVWKGNDVEYFVLPPVKIKHGSRHYSGVRNKSGKRFPIKPWLKFFGFWIAEGWTSEGKNGQCCVCIANQDNDLLSEMKQILESFGYSAYQREGILRVRDYQLFHYLRRFGKSYSKFIPSEIKSLSKDLLGILLDYYIKGDGHVYGRSGKGLSATTISVKLRDDLQEIALKIGISAYFRLKYKKGTVFSSPGPDRQYKKKYRQSHDSWDICFIRKNMPIIMPSTIKKHNYTEEWVEFEGHVFCVTVPNHVVYIRRNGIPLWCGNSDPAMNWRLSSLDKYSLVSNSDSHSFWPWRIGREANVFDLKELTYRDLLTAIREKDPKRFLYTTEVEPAYGKYHFDGHRACNISLSPEEAKKLGNWCPVCKRQLTIGVLHRVEQLADRPEGFVPRDAIPFKSLIPLTEIISARMGIEQLYSKRIWAVYNDLIKAFGSEFAVLLDAEEAHLGKVADAKLAKAIVDVREGKVEIKPGYDGVYGYPVFEDSDRDKLERRAAAESGKPEKKAPGRPSRKPGPSPGQKSLMEF